MVKAESSHDQISRSLSDVVYEKILESILSREYPQNSKLPSESHLSSVYQVSRPVVREALGRLREDGLVVSRQGSGTYVKAYPPKENVLSFAPISSIADMQRCFEFRLGVEGEAAYLAASRFDSQDCAEFDSAFEELEQAVELKQLGVTADYNFHKSIAVQSKNSYYERTLNSLRESVESGMNLARQLFLMQHETRMRVVQDEHRKIYDAIRSGDSSAAREAMRQHLGNAKRRIFEGV